MNEPLGESGLTGPVLVVGTGLLGTSIGLALGAHGVDVHLEDVNPENVRTASGLGASWSSSRSRPTCSASRSRPR